MNNAKTTFFGRRIGYNEEKRKRMRIQRIKRRIGGTFRWFIRRGWLLCVLLVVVGAFAWMNRFYVNRFNPLELRYLQYIDIDGNRMLSWEDVVQNAQVEPGMRMSEVDPLFVEAALLRNPLIHSAEVEKRFPSSLTIKLREASPVVSMFEDGKVTVYSERGLSLPLSMTTALRLPVAGIESRDNIKKISKFLNEMRLVDAMMYDAVSQIFWSEKDEAFEVYFRDVGYRVLFPESDLSSDVFALYESVKHGFPKNLRCAGEVDMRYAGFAYVRNFDKRCVNG